MQDPLIERPGELLVAGHVNVDRFFTVRSFPAPDRTVPIIRSRVCLGGTAANLALVAARYGVATGLIARIGDGFPREFLTRLRQANIDLRALVPVPGAVTPTCYTVEDEQGHQRTLIDQGAMAGMNTATPPRDVLADYSWLHITTGNPQYHLRLLREARKRGLRAAADPAQEIHYWWGRSGFRELLAGAEILFGNRSEIARATKLAGVATTERLVERVPLVIRTEGSEGVTAFARGNVVHVPAARPRRVRSIVGAGDAFRGGFYAGWFEGRPLKECLIAGTRSAARWVAGPEE
jgi:6-phosphofructokinase 1/ribokinase